MGNERIPEIALNFIFKNENSTFRESIFKNKFKFDFQITAAHNNQYLFIYERDVDRYGVDLVMEFGGVLRPVQLKTIVKSFRKSSSTQTWKINARFFRPQIRELKHCDQTNLKKVIQGGIGGALIVQQITWDRDDSIDVKYHFFDYTLLDLILDKTIDTSILRDEKKKIEKLEKVRQKILTTNEEIPISYSYLLDVEKEHDRLLAFMGFDVGQANGSIFEYLEWIRTNPNMRSLGVEALQRILSRGKIPDTNFKR